MKAVRLCAGSLVWAVVWVCGIPHTARAQSSPVRGLYNWIHSTGDAERSFAFYRDLFGLELARSPFAGAAPANAPPERIRPAAEAGSDPLVWDLTNTHGSRFRTVFMRAANTPFGLELSEFFDVPRGERPANPWDPGAATLVFTVRDLDATVSKLKARGAPVVTLGGDPIDSPRGRAIVVRDPDGCLVEVRQAATAAERTMDSVALEDPVVWAETAPVAVPLCRILSPVNMEEAEAVVSQAAAAAPVPVTVTRMAAAAADSDRVVAMATVV